MGALYGTLFLKMSQASAGKGEMTLKDLVVMFQTGEKGIQDIGKASVGDKTLIDTLSPAVRALEKAEEDGKAMQDALKDFEAAANIYYTAFIIARGAILHSGTQSQKDLLLPKIANGEIKVAFSLSEPNSGTDAASLVCSAVEDGDNYIINGQKIFCSCAQVADYILLMARTSKESKRKGITMFLLDPKSPGVKIRNIRKLGLKPMDLNEIFLENVVIPKDKIVGKVNQGWTNVLATLEFERCCLTAINLGAAQAATDLALAYAKEREQFGQPISKFQGLRWILSDMATDLEAARQLTFFAAARKDRGEKHGMEASMAKLFASEMVNRVTAKALQIHGGYGYTKEYPVERFYRDARVFTIYEGTSEIQRIVIANHLLEDRYVGTLR